MLQLVNYSDDSTSSGDENEQSYAAPNDMLENDTTKGLLQEIRDSTAVGKKDLPENVDDKKANISVLSAKKKKRPKNNENKPLPLPLAIEVMFPDRTKNSSKGDHQGRKRTFEHVEGNWSTYVYIPVVNNKELGEIQDSILEKLKKHFFEKVYPFPVEECHISLSRTLPVRHYWIEPMFKKLSELIRQAHTFNYSVRGLKVYCNDERTRTFIGIETSNCYEKMYLLSKFTDQVYEDFGLQKFYSSPSFHISVAWCLGDKKEEIEKLFIGDNFLQNIYYFFADKVCMKTGNKVYQISLL